MTNDPSTSEPFLLESEISEARRVFLENFPEFGEADFLPTPEYVVREEREGARSCETPRRRVVRVEEDPSGEGARRPFGARACERKQRQREHPQRCSSSG